MRLLVTMFAVLAAAAPAAQSFLRNQPQRVTVEARAVAGKEAGRYELQVRVTPNPGMHVYAPGNRVYRPVAVTLQPADGISVGKPVYPKAETYFFAPLRETVLVYSAPFTLRVPLRATGGPVTLRGTLDYQACDDALCYPPQSAPFTVTVPPPADSGTRTR